MPLPGIFDHDAGAALIEQMVRRVLRALLRSVVFSAGIVGGYLIAAVVSSFGGSASTDFMGVFFGLGLMLAAPLCWVAAVWGKKGDYWTLGYGGAWLVFIATFYGLGFVEAGKPPVTSAYAKDVAFVLLGILYLVVLPVGVIVYRRRARSS